MMQSHYDGLGEKCAVFGIYGKRMDVSRLTYFGLFALQHRGQESSGIATANGRKISCYKAMGLVSSVFREEIVDILQGHIAIGHNRYSTSKDSKVEHAHPITVAKGKLAFVHNGNLPSVKLLVDFLQDKKIHTDGLSDSRLMAEALGWYVQRGESLTIAMYKCYPLFTGAFSAIAMTKDQIVGARDKKGVRPLSLARLNGGYVFASETCAFAPIGAKFMREVAPGEIVSISSKGVKSFQFKKSEQKLDIFEFVYFARHDSNMLGKSIYEVRKNFGRYLAKENKMKVDIVVPVPETAIPMAIGFAQESKIPFDIGLSKNRYIQRTFIEPDQKLRNRGIKMKLHAIPEVIKGKRVCVIDDSIVRGTTSKQIVKLLFEAGAKEVHFLVGSAPICFPDFYGIDIPYQRDLIAFNKNIDEICDFLGATSLHYLSYKGMIKATGLDEKYFCTACFTGVYPIDIYERVSEFVYSPRAENNS
jgi:amidophosphoribosyltransferase